MGFLDDFGKKISSAGQEAIAKTKDLADIAKLNSGISDEENKIKAAFTEIGKLYFEIHSDDCEECFESYFLNIRESKGKIEEYGKQIAEIKGVRKCPNCGEILSVSSAFCPKCGTKIENI